MTSVIRLPILEVILGKCDSNLAIVEHHSIGSCGKQRKHHPYGGEGDRGNIREMDCEFRKAEPEFRIRRISDGQVKCAVIVPAHYASLEGEGAETRLATVCPHPTLADASKGTGGIQQVRGGVVHDRCTAANTGYHSTRLN